MQLLTTEWPLVASGGKEKFILFNKGPSFTTLYLSASKATATHSILVLYYFGN